MTPLVDEVIEALKGGAIDLSLKEKANRIKKKQEAQTQQKFYEQSNMLRAHPKKMKRYMDMFEEKLKHKVVATPNERRQRLKDILPKLNTYIHFLELEKLQACFANLEDFSEDKARSLAKAIEGLVTTKEQVEALGDAVSNIKSKPVEIKQTKTACLFDLECAIHDMSITSTMKKLRLILKEEKFSIDEAASLVKLLQEKTKGEMIFSSVIPYTFERCAPEVIRDEKKPRVLTNDEVRNALTIRAGTLLDKLQDDIKVCQDKGGRFTNLKPDALSKPRDVSVGLMETALNFLKHIVSLLMYPFVKKPVEVTFYKAPEGPYKTVREAYLELIQLDAKLFIFNNELLLSTPEEKRQRYFDR